MELAIPSLNDPQWVPCQSKRSWNNLDVPAPLYLQKEEKPRIMSISSNQLSVVTLCKG